MPVIIGMDPHERSATIEVIDERGDMLTVGKFGTDQVGCAEMLLAGRWFAERVWAVEGRTGEVAGAGTCARGDDQTTRHRGQDPTPPGGRADHRAGDHRQEDQGRRQGSPRAGDCPRLHAARLARHRGRLARLLADVGDVHRFGNRDRFASWNGTACPVPATGGSTGRCTCTHRCTLTQSGAMRARSGSTR
ncbi:transposase [Amycolatopsis sp. RTGN1]|uniref:transposase n=1 Tax=Amycolatopsis ponsaeliensis TaxID=2992142 RepID=UPI0033078E28